ncbi:MAG: arylsulfotransferase family protein [Thermoanaerobaculia bacterium]|nr:arylsulfotransferase family protein [Thermoanaerobaculia bacterium]
MRRARSAGPIRSLPVALTLACSLACGGGAGGPGPETPAAWERFGSPDWVAIHDPERAWYGVNLGLSWRRVPILFDANGRVVHAWPEARVKSRVRLLPDGHLLGIGLGRDVVEYDWEGQPVWSWMREDLLPHHDLRRLDNGNTLVITAADGDPADRLVEIDPAGRIVWEWRAGEHLAEWLEERGVELVGDATHVNSVQVLPENRHHDAGDRRFRPGNLLISARNLHAVFVIDRETGEPVWFFDHELDKQHEALMTPSGWPGAGRIQLFDNGYGNRYTYRRSEILEIEPATGEVVWAYRSDDFFSPTGGVQQALPNGNVLIGSTRGGRVFEVDRKGEIVWQWTPPFDPVRPHRYPWDHCPQLAARTPPRPVPVTPPRGYRYVDKRVYQFTPRGGLREVVIDGRRRTFLAANDDCRRLLLPADAVATVRYGLAKRNALRAGHADLVVRFALRLQPEGSDRPIELFADTVDLTGGTWRGWNLDLAEHSLRWVELCVATEILSPSPGGDAGSFAFWEVPYIQPGGAAVESEQPDSLQPLTPEELAARQQHLRTLGYVD